MANENFDETLFLDAPRSNSSSSTYSSVNGRSATGNSDSDDDDRDDGATGGPHFGEEVGGGEGANAAAVPIDHGGANDEDDENNAVMTHDYGFKGWLIRTFNSSPTSSSCLRGRQKVRINDGNGYRMVDPGMFTLTTSIRDWSRRELKMDDTLFRLGDGDEGSSEANRARVRVVVLWHCDVCDGWLDYRLGTRVASRHLRVVARPHRVRTGTLLYPFDHLILDSRRLVSVRS